MLLFEEAGSFEEDGGGGWRKLDEGLRIPEEGRG
jgi:hypothetical protein